MKIQPIGNLSVIAAVGLDFEAAAAEGEGVSVVSGLNRRRYAQQLHKAAQRGAQAIVSFGVAGGLSPGLRAGDVVVASSVVTERGSFATCPLWSEALLETLPAALHGSAFGASAPLMTVQEKEAIWSATRAGTVDVESGDAAEIASLYGLPYAAVRVVLDPACRAIPPIALSGVDEDGRTCSGKVVKMLTRRPQDLGGLLSIANDARKAIASLHHCRQAMGPLFAFGNAGQRAYLHEGPASHGPAYARFLLVRLPGLFARSWR